MKETIATIASMSALVAPTVTRVETDGSRKVGGHRQKPCSETFSTSLPVAFAQQTPNTGAYVSYWCLEELKVTAMRMHTSENLVSDPTQPKVTVEVFIPSASRLFIYVPSEWFLEYTKSIWGLINDC